MPEQFSPYREWLKLTTSKPNHFELLGLPEWETESAAIDTAAALALANVRKIQPGQHASAWVSLLNEIEQARDCLLDPVAREKYLATLRSTTSFQEKKSATATLVDLSSSEASNLLPPTADSVAEPAPIAAAIIVSESTENKLTHASQEAEQKPVLPSIRTPRKKSGRRSFFYNAVRLLFLSFVIAAAWYGYQNQETVLAWLQEKALIGNTAREPKKVEKVEKTENHGNSPRKSVPSKPTKTNTGKPTQRQAIATNSTEPASTPLKPVTEKHNSEKQPSSTESEEPILSLTTEELASQQKARQEEFRKAQQVIIQLLKNKKIAQAKEKLEALEEKFTEEVFEESIDGLVLLTDGVDNFWGAVKDRIARLKAGQTMTLNNHTVVIVEASPKMLIIRSFGKNHRFRVESLPHGLALRFASQQLDKDAASTFVILGAYQYVSPDGSTSKAEGYWKLASDKGFDSAALFKLPKK